MILNDVQILEAHRRGQISIEPFDEQMVQPASYDLKLGEKAALTSAKGVVTVADNDGLIVKPGDFGVLINKEEIKFGLKHTARICLRSYYARRGLIITNGPQIDPGFEGRLIVGIMNPTPKNIVVRKDEAFLTLEVRELTQPSSRPYSGRYQGIRDLRSTDIERVMEGGTMAFTEIPPKIDELTSKVEKMSNELGILKWVIPCFLAGITLLVAILALIKIS